MKKNILYTGIVFVLLFSACKKETDNFNTPAISEYAPLTVGKYIAYDLDSTLFINFGTKDTVVHYQIKYQVDAAITDNLGRPAFRIFRYIRKTPADAWTADNSAMAINTGNSFEFVENNLRFLKLMQPMKEGFSWKGNKYIQVLPPSEPASSYPILSYLDDWDYTYQDMDQPLSLGTFNLDSTITVNQRDEVLNDPNNKDVYSEINIGIERYAKGIGMVYRNFLHREWQPPTPGGSSGYALGYGITLTMIDHN